MGDDTNRTPSLLRSTVRAYQRNFRKFLLPLGAYILLGGLASGCFMLILGSAQVLSSHMPGQALAALPEKVFLPFILFTIVIAGIVASVTVRLLRIVLFEDQPDQLARGLRFGWLELRFCGYSIVLWIGLAIVEGLFLAVVGVLFTRLFGPLDIGTLSAGGDGGIMVPQINPQLFLAYLVYIVSSIWLTLRVVLMGPAVAANVTDSFFSNFAGSWKIMKGHVWEMGWNGVLIFVGLLVIEIVVLFGGVALHNLPLLFIGIFFLMLLFLAAYPFMTTWVATAYRLYGGPLPEIGGAEILSEPEHQEQDVDTRPDTNG